MPEVLLFIKDFELGSKISSVCVDHEKNVEFSDESTDPKNFPTKAQLAVIDMDVKVFSSVGLISELKRHGLKIIGIMKKINNRENSKLKSNQKHCPLLPDNSQHCWIQIFLLIKQ